MIRILLCGANGKMGHVIASCVAERGNMEIVAGIDLNIKTYGAFPIYKDFALSLIHICLYPRRFRIIKRFFVLQWIRFCSLAW